MSKHHPPTDHDGGQPNPERGAPDEASAAKPGDTAPEEAAAVQGEAAAGPAPDQAGLAEQVARLTAENSELKDQYLRKLADYENFRKRMFREKEETALYANSGIIGDLIGVIDNFDRAVQSSEASKDFQVLHDGVVMIRQTLLQLLESKYGLKRFDSAGADFDPNVHEAMMSEAGECAAPVVVEEFMKGYKLHDRVIRPAKVKVRMPSGGASAPQA